MTKLLALDSSTEACSCALWLDGQLFESFAVIPRQHAQQLLPMIAALMQEHRVQFSDLDAIAFGQGPGSFTGLRIAAGAVQGLAFAANLPVLPISTLAAQALALVESQGITTDTAILSCLDARIEELYWGWYRWTASGLQLCGEEQLSAPELLTAPTLPASVTTVAVGSGLVYQPRWPQALLAQLSLRVADVYPRSHYIAKLAAQQWQQGKRGVAAKQAEPIYLRDKVTHN
jgi:tRNA threonylcarbamoyladenosine biosynthesis protein TsaB